MTIRCIKCHLRSDLCLCKLIPVLPTTTRIVVLMHHLEINKPSNTVHLMSLALPNLEIRFQGLRQRPLDLSGLVSPERDTLILFPETSALPLSVQEAKKFIRPITLVVPDGTWQQAKKIAAHASSVLGARRVCVPVVEPSRYILRKADRTDRLCTLEAVARAIGILESPSVQSSLEHLLDAMVERALIIRNQGGPIS